MHAHAHARIVANSNHVSLATRSMGGMMPELGGSSDLLYNDSGLDPAHGSVISADQLDRLMLGE